MATTKKEVSKNPDPPKETPPEPKKTVRPQDEVHIKEIVIKQDVSREDAIEIFNKQNGGEKK